VVRAVQDEQFGAIRMRLAVANLAVAAEMAKDVGSVEAEGSGGAEVGGTHAES
jgi:hypothetical protein